MNRLNKVFTLLKNVGDQISDNVSEKKEDLARVIKNPVTEKLLSHASQITDHASSIKGLAKKSAKKASEFVVSYVPGSDAYDAYVKDSPCSYSDQKHKNATFLFAPRQDLVGILFDEIKISNENLASLHHVDKDAEENTIDGYYYGSKENKADEQKKAENLIYPLPPIHDFEVSDKKTKETDQSIMQGADWPKKVNNASQCLFAVNIKPAQHCDPNNDLEKIINHLPYDDKGRPDFSKLKIVFLGIDEAYDDLKDRPHRYSNSSESEEYLEEYRSAIQKHIKGSLGYDIPNECFIVLNDEKNPMNKLKTSLDVSVDQLLQKNDVQAKEIQSLTPFVYSKEKHKNAAFIFSQYEDTVGSLLTAIQQSHNNDVLYDDSDDYGKKTNEEYHYGQEKYEENETGNIKKVVYHLPPICLLEKEITSIVNDNSMIQGVDWRKKTKNSSQCLFAVDVSPGTKIHDSTEDLPKLIKNLPRHQDGSIDFSKLKIVYMYVNQTYKAARSENKQEELENYLKGYRSSLQQIMQEQYGYKIPDECFVILNDEKKPMNTVKTSFDVSVDQLLGNSSID